MHFKSNNAFPKSVSCVR